MVLDDGPLRELIPDFDKMEGFPLKTRVKKEGVYLLTAESAFKAPIQPPPLKDHGLYAGSLAKLVRWLAKLCEDEGVQIFPGLRCGPSALRRRSGDRRSHRRQGRQHSGKKKATFEPGMDLKAKVTVISEGSRGNVTRDVVRQLGLDAGKNPQNYAIGVKEIIEVPEGQVEPGEVVLTMGWPLDTKTFGGAFMYTLEDNLVSLGLVIGLDYRDPNLDPQTELQRLKTHPLDAAAISAAEKSCNTARRRSRRAAGSPCRGPTPTVFTRGRLRRFPERRTAEGRAPGDQDRQARRRRHFRLFARRRHVGEGALSASRKLSKTRLKAKSSTRRVTSTSSSKAGSTTP